MTKTFAMIVDSIGKPSVVRRDLRSFSKEIVKELNNYVPFDFRLEVFNADINKRSLDLLFEVSSLDYHFGAELYVWPDLLLFTVYELKECCIMFDTKMNIPIDASAQTIASLLLSYITPEDLVKSRQLN